MALTVKHNTLTSELGGGKVGATEWDENHEITGSLASSDLSDSSSIVKTTGDQSIAGIKTITGSLGIGAAPSVFAFEIANAGATFALRSTNTLDANVRFYVNGSERGKFAATNGGELYFEANGSEKFRAVSTGLQVTGSVDADTVAGDWIASQAEAEAGTATTKVMTPLRVAQAITALGGGGTPTNFIARMSGNQTVSASAEAKVQFSSEQTDVGGYYDPTTNYRWTPPAGTYLVKVRIVCAQGATTTPDRLKIKKNGSTVIADFYCAALTAQHSIELSEIVALNGTDYVEVFYTNSNSSSATIYGGVTVAQSEFMGVKL